MFTGIVEPGRVVERKLQTLVIDAPLLEEAGIGASVAINGVCLTVVERDGCTCRFDLAVETIARSTLGALEPGHRVNLERPVRAGEELGGHVVQGHVDGVGTILEKAGERVRVGLPQELSRYIVEKGSITVDGVSLTVSAVTDDWFEVALIPTTLEVTTFGTAEVYDQVNLEVDVLAKYVEKLLLERTR